MAHSDVQSELSDVRLAVNVERLQQYLKEQVPELPCSNLLVKQFGTGTSNPTYLVWSASNEEQRFVLRRRPPGTLLQGAHQIDREYRVMKALHAHGVPVPKMIAFCEDKEILGQDFYVMECIPGRVLQDGGTTSFASASDRSQLWKSIAAAVAALHAVDYKAAGLEGYGKVGDYVARQVKTWFRNFEAADVVVQKELQRPELTASMQQLRDYLLAHMGVMAPEPTCVVHGDLNVHNMLMHPSEPRVATILDWEISTLGHPLVDMDYAASGLDGGWMPREGTLSLGANTVEGLPTRQEFIKEYFRQRGLPVCSDEVLEFVSLVNMFRFAAICHGVLGRGLSGNAASGTSKNHVMAQTYIKISEKAAEILQRKGAGRQSKL